jgi:uncharacterized protein YjaZ
MNYLQTFESYSNYERIDEGLMDFFSKVKSKFSGKEEEIKTELKDKLDIDENSSKAEIKSKVEEILDGQSSKQGLMEKAKIIGGILGQLIEWCVYIYIYWNWGHHIWVVIAFVIWFFIRYKVIGKKKES